MKKRILVLSVGLLALALLAVVYLTEARETDVAESSSSSEYIEVCQGVVYLPPGTKFVTCHGKKMKVIKVVPTDKEELTLGGCYCPDCCAGVCAVWVICNPQPEVDKDSYGRDSETGSKGQSGFCIAYLSCGD